MNSDRTLRTDRMRQCIESLCPDKMGDSGGTARARHSPIPDTASLLGSSDSHADQHATRQHWDDCVDWRGRMTDPPSLRLPDDQAVPGQGRPQAYCGWRSRTQFPDPA